MNNVDSIYLSIMSVIVSITGYICTKTYKDYSGKMSELKEIICKLYSIVFFMLVSGGLFIYAIIKYNSKEKYYGDLIVLAFALAFLLLIFVMDIKLFKIYWDRKNAIIEENNKLRKCWICECVIDDKVDICPNCGHDNSRQGVNYLNVTKSEFKDDSEHAENKGTERFPAKGSGKRKFTDLPENKRKQALNLILKVNIPAIAAPWLLFIIALLKNGYIQKEFLMILLLWEIISILMCMLINKQIIKGIYEKE